MTKTTHMIANIKNAQAIKKFYEDTHTEPEEFNFKITPPTNFNPLEKDAVTNGYVLIRNNTDYPVDAFIATYQPYGIPLNVWTIEPVNTPMQSTILKNTDDILRSTISPSTTSINKYNIISGFKDNYYEVSFDVTIESILESGACFILDLNATTQHVLSINSVSDFTILSETENIPSTTSLRPKITHLVTITYDNTKNFITVTLTNDINSSTKNINFNYPKEPVHFGFIANKNIQISKFKLLKSS